MSKKIRIFFLVPNLEGGGSERVISLIVNNLDKTRFVPTLVLAQKKGIYLENISSDLKIIDLNKKRIRYIGLSLIKLIRTEKPDIVLSTLGHLNLFVALIRPFLPKKTIYIARESNTVSQRNRDESFPLLFDILFKTVYHNYDKIICQCNFMQEDLIRNYNIKPSKTEVIYNPVDFNFINKKLTEKAAFKIDESKTNYVYVGRLTKEKRPDHVIRAFAKFAEPQKHHLYMMGIGPLRKSLEKLIWSFNLNNSISLVGLIENPFVHVAKCNCLISTSLYEGFPNVVLEANACGIPVLAYNYPGGINEIIEENVNGVIIENGNINELVLHMKRISKMGFDKERITKKTYQNFNLESIINDYESLFYKSVNNYSK